MCALVTSGCFCLTSVSSTVDMNTTTDVFSCSKSSDMMICDSHVISLASLMVQTATVNSVICR